VLELTVQNQPPAQKTAGIIQQIELLLCQTLAAAQQQSQPGAAKKLQRLACLIRLRVLAQTRPGPDALEDVVNNLFPIFDT